MSKYRKKPMVVDATQFFYDGDPVPGVFYPSKSEDGKTYIGDAYVVTIHDQRVYLENGDWIITEPDGEHHYPCKPDIFAKTYTEVTDDVLQPIWSQAPEWAMWWAVDPNGWAHWFQEEPILALTITYCGWVAKTINGVQMGAELWAAELDLALGIDWRTLKQQRVAP